MFLYLIISQLVYVGLGTKEISTLVPESCGHHEEEFAFRADEVCANCSNLNNDPEIYTECRENCFFNTIFNACLEVYIPSTDVETEHVIEENQSVDGGVEPSKIVPPVHHHLDAISTEPNNCKNYVLELYNKLDFACFKCQELVLKKELMSGLRRQKNEIYTLCKSNCFHNGFFEQCLIKSKFEEETLRRNRDFLNGKSTVEPGWIKPIEHKSAEDDARRARPIANYVMNVECKGVYDRSLFARLDRICEDCYNLFREPIIYTLCSLNFTAKGVASESKIDNLRFSKDFAEKFKSTASLEKTGKEIANKIRGKKNSSESKTATHKVQYQSRDSSNLNSKTVPRKDWKATAQGTESKPCVLRNQRPSHYR